jgi:hypothetical protein
MIGAIHTNLRFIVAANVAVDVAVNATVAAGGALATASRKTGVMGAPSRSAAKTGWLYSWE